MAGYQVFAINPLAVALYRDLGIAEGQAVADRLRLVPEAAHPGIQIAFMAAELAAIVAGHTTSRW